ncbi:MAG: anti-sigma factor family protein, partial [Planctomycetaceae bacterium]
MSQVGFQDDAPVDEVDELLVAYLDGELPPDEVRDLEKRLGSDASLRARLRELQNGWEMLDELPLASSSNQLLETTLRMAALEGQSASKTSPSKVARGKLPWFAWLAVAAAACFVLGLAVVNGRDYLRFQSHLRDLPVAMHLDAYLNAGDLEVMEQLRQMPEWQQATEMADQFGKWDVHVAKAIDEATPRTRQDLLAKLPLEDQKTVASAWERFERIAPDKRDQAYELAEQVAEKPHAESLLATMDRFALWRESWKAEDRDFFATATNDQREAFLKTALDKTKKQWAQESSQKLSNEDVETIYHALRQIGRLRLKTVVDDAPPEVQSMIYSFGSKDQSLDPQVEAIFLRRMFDPDYPTFARPEATPSVFTLFRRVADKVREPLRESELDWLHAVLPPKWSDFVDAASG